MTCRTPSPCSRPASSSCRCSSTISAIDLPAGPCPADCNVNRAAACTAWCARCPAGERRAQIAVRRLRRTARRFTLLITQQRCIHRRRWRALRAAASDLARRLQVLQVNRTALAYPHPMRRPGCSRRRRCAALAPANTLSGSTTAMVPDAAGPAGAAQHGWPRAAGHPPAPPAAPAMATPASADHAAAPAGARRQARGTTGSRWPARPAGSSPAATRDRAHPGR